MGLNGGGTDGVFGTRDGTIACGVNVDGMGIDVNTGCVDALKRNSGHIDGGVGRGM